MNEVILLFVLLYTKHTIFDFFLQTPYQYLNKGTYGHPGGILHALYHGIATAIILMVVGFPLLTAMVVLVVESFVHYHIDWCKMNLNKKFDWKCNTSDNFWMLVGTDQWLHFMTYVFIIMVIV